MDATTFYTGVEHVPLDEADQDRVYPAARCRGCGVVTWRCALSRGRWPVPATHAEDCHRPPGRIDLIEALGSLERETVGERLRGTISDHELAELAEEVGLTCS